VDFAKGISFDSKLIKGSLELPKPTDIIAGSRAPCRARLDNVGKLVDLGQLFDFVWKLIDITHRVVGPERRTLRARLLCRRANLMRPLARLHAQPQTGAFALHDERLLVGRGRTLSRGRVCSSHSCRPR